MARLCMMVLGAGTLAVGSIDAQAQDAEVLASAEEGAQILGDQEIRELVAPVALYPDDLLAIVLPATTNPFQIVQSQRFLDKQKEDPSLQPDSEWDPSVLALLNYPDVVAEMNNDLDWTENLGNAVIDQQEDVMDMIQQVRAESYAGGYLKSGEQQVVVQDKETIVIQSASPEVIYVPQYDPQVVVMQDYSAYPPVVYSNPYPYYYSPAATFWTGALVGASFAYAFDWFDNDIDIGCCGSGWGGNNDINIDRGDINIGGDVNIGDRGSRVEHHGGDRFNADRRQVNGQDKMTWNGKKSRQKTAKGKPSASTRPAAGVAPANKQRPAASTQPATKDKKKAKGGQKVGGSKGKSQAGLGTYETGQRAKKDSQRGNQSLNNSKKKQRSQGSSVKKKQGSGQGFGNVGNGARTKQQSSRGNKSMKSSGKSVKKRR
ncbi:MAG: DUF3300 domain-containing protein [Dongiaceae bacterium]